LNEGRAFRFDNMVVCPDSAVVVPTDKKYYDDRQISFSGIAGMI